jgi:hypothetical protein
MLSPLTGTVERVSGTKRAIHTGVQSIGRGSLVPETFACYGKRFGKLDRCEGCDERAWCADAADKKPLGGPHAGPTGDDATFETMEALETAAFDWSASAGEVFGVVVQCCAERPDRIAAVCMRIKGYSYARIGRACGKSKQAVAKDLGRIAQENPTIGKELRRCYHLAGEVGRLNERLAETFARAKVAGTRLTGRYGLYGRLASEFGLSETAVRLRLFRMVVVNSP